MKALQNRWTAILLACSLVMTACGAAGGSGGTGMEIETTEHSPEQISQEKSSAFTAAQQEFAEFCTQVFREEMECADTLDLHYTLLAPETYGIVPGEVTLGNYLLSDMIGDKKELRQLQARLSEIDKSTLTFDQQITYDALAHTLEASLLGEGLELYEQPLAPTIGVQAQLPILLAEYAFHSVEDVEDYLELLSQIDRYYGEILVFENQKADAGLGPSDATIDTVIESCESYLVNPEENFLTETFETRLAELDGLDEKQKADLRTRHTAIIRDHFLPAYQSLIDGMTALKGRGINEGGLANFKDGQKYYEYLLAIGPGLSYSVPELKAALNRRMKQDYEAIQQLYVQYPNLDELVQASSFTLTDPTEILEDLKQKMTTDFPSMAECDYQINYVPKYLEDSLSPAFYLTAPLDNTNRNTIYINNGTSDASTNLYTTLAHEGFPGHLYQTVYSRLHAESPLQALLSCSGANEGWATYVEDYASTLDNGLPPGVGEYRALLRSFSLGVHSVLDIGINYDGWTYNQAAQYITSCFQVDEETVHTLWQTMIDNPTNYLEYCGGYIELLEMREQAETTLGENFSLLDFHTFFLDIGPVPFTVIRPAFEKWLADQCS